MLSTGIGLPENNRGKFWELFCERCSEARPGLLHPGSNPRSLLSATPPSAALFNGSMAGSIAWSSPVRTPSVLAPSHILLLLYLSSLSTVSLFHSSLSVSFSHQFFQGRGPHTSKLHVCGWCTIFNSVVQVLRLFLPVYVLFSMPYIIPFLPKSTMGRLFLSMQYPVMHSFLSLGRWYSLSYQGLHPAFRKEASEHYVKSDLLLCPYRVF